MSIFRKAILLLLCMFIFSCATAGTKINMEVIRENIKVGESTKADVLKVCGEPLAKNRDVKNELEIWHYAYVRKNLTGKGFLTHALGIGEEWKSDTIVVDIYFKDDVVFDIKSQSSTIKRLHYSID